MPELSIIIVNYNSCHFLQISLEALSTALKGLRAETIVVDNASDDNSRAVVRAQFPWVNLVENASNKGFSKANNQGIKQAKGKYILLLNPDTIVQQAALLNSLSVLKQSPQNAAVGVKMIDGSGRFLPESKRGLPSPQTALYKFLGLARLWPKSKRFAHYYLGHLPDNQRAEIEILAGAFMMCRAEVLKECKGFDEDFFMYGEDIDLSYRIRQKGYAVFYLPEAPIIHFKGESAGRDALWAERFHQAMLLFSKKHFINHGIFFNGILKYGISLKKRCLGGKVRQHKTTNLALQNLIVLLTPDEQLRQTSFVAQFKSYVLQQPPDLDLSNGDAILFMPKIKRRLAIEIMQTHAGSKQFYFASSSGAFVLTSPHSTGLGEVFSKYCKLN